MKINFNNQIQEVKITQSADSIFAKTETGTEYIFIKYAENHFKYNDNGILLDVYVFANKNDIYLKIGRDYLYAKKEDNTKLFGKNESASSANKLELKSQMPGSVVKIEVNIGDEVSEGQSLIVIEAMKMESKLHSTINGIVTKINVSASEQIDTDKVLIVVEKI